MSDATTPEEPPTNDEAMSPDEQLTDDEIEQVTEAVAEAELEAAITDAIEEEIAEEIEEEIAEEIAEEIEETVEVLAEAALEGAVAAELLEEMVSSGAEGADAEAVEAGPGRDRARGRGGRSRSSSSRRLSSRPRWRKPSKRSSRPKPSKRRWPSSKPRWRPRSKPSRVRGGNAELAEALDDLSDAVDAELEILDEDDLLAEAAPLESPYDRPGQWFVVHTQSGYEKKVKQNLEARISSMNMEERIHEVVIPMEDVVEVKNGKKVVVQKKVFPGYLLVRCNLDDDSWYVVRNTPGVTGFVGQGAKPSPAAAP